MKSNKMKILNFDKNLEQLKRVPKSVSKNEKFEKIIAQKVDTSKVEETLNNAAKKEVGKTIEYKEDLLLKPKIEKKQNE